ncbi:nuclear transport factor 2-like [Miscanthus floridulus]|uniref:nuclear transport factor 2-like n=1 Tax=Miscanthus floridulus TaxID=154761 RepID=UPI0034594459
MALPLARLVLPGFPACQCQPQPHLRFPKRHLSFAAPASSRATFAACAVASAPAAPAPHAPEAETVEQVGPRTRLVVQNIPWDSTADEMRALFENHGSVVGVQFFSTRRAGGIFHKNKAVGTSGRKRLLEAKEEAAGNKKEGRGGLLEGRKQALGLLLKTRRAVASSKKHCFF